MLTFSPPLPGRAVTEAGQAQGPGVARPERHAADRRPASCDLSLECSLKTPGHPPPPLLSDSEDDPLTVGYSGLKAISFYSFHTC